MPRRTRTPAEILAAHLDTVNTPDGCYRFQGAHTRGGYGSLRIDAINYLAHRLAWSLTHGPIPPGMRVCHRCDQPDCCRVDHLWLGTAAENTADMVAKGRAATGDRSGSRKYPERVPRWERNGHAKLDAEKVRAMRHLRDAGATFRAIASRYGVDPFTARAAITRRTWRHVA
jgi:hypothetical protein